MTNTSIRTVITVNSFFETHKLLTYITLSNCNHNIIQNHHVYFAANYATRRRRFSISHTRRLKVTAKSEAMKNDRDML